MVGTGFSGLVDSGNLHARGISVTVVEMAKQAMIVVDYEVAAMVNWEVAPHNVGLLLDDAVAAFEPKPGGVIARLTSGRTVEADLVLLSIGTNLVACQMSMDLMGIRREELIDGIQVGGVASYLEASESRQQPVYLTAGNFSPVGMVV